MIFINPSSTVNPEIPNLGLIYAATFNNARIIDLNTKPAPANRFLEYPSKEVYISVRPFTQDESLKIKKQYLAQYPTAKVTSVSGFIDVLCCYPYIDFKDGLKYPISFLDTHPFPKYELLDSFQIFKQNWQNGKWNYAIMTSLGCPYQCIYCKSHNRRWTARSAQNCFEELKQAKEKYGITKFALLDDCFNLDKKRLLEFCALIEPLKLKWLCTNGLRADRFDEDIACAMARSGCIHIGFGVECLDDAILNKIKKGLTVSQINNAVKIAKKYFRGVHCFFIIGLPGTTFQKDCAGLKWVIQEGINGHFSYWSPFNESNEAAPFYGKAAGPKSTAYDKKQQIRLYLLTKYMRADCNVTFFAMALNRIKLIWLFDKKHLLKHIYSELKKRILI